MVLISFPTFVFFLISLSFIAGNNHTNLPQHRKLISCDAISNGYTDLGCVGCTCSSGTYLSEACSGSSASLTSPASCTCLTFKLNGNCKTGTCNTWYSTCPGCPAGRYNPNSGHRFTTCTQCSAGNYCPAGSSLMTPCPAGQYQGSSGQIACPSCPAGELMKITVH